MFEHGFLPLIHDHSLRHPPPPPDNDRVSDHNAMLAFPQEKISHYTTAHLTNLIIIFLLFNFLLDIGAPYPCHLDI